MKIAFRFFSICYFLGFALHLADLFDFRLQFSEMDFLWRFLTIALIPLDLIASIGLWLQKPWGVLFLAIVASYELAAFVGAPHIYGDQSFLLYFHAASLVFFSFWALKGKFPKISYLQNKCR